MYNLITKNCEGYIIKGTFRKIIKKLFHWEQLDNKGRVFRLPCTIYEKVYVVPYNRGHVSVEQIMRITINDGISFKCSKGTIFDTTELGTRIFLNPEDAEKALSLSIKYDTLADYIKNERIFINTMRKKYLKNTMFNYKTGELRGYYDNLFENNYQNNRKEKIW